MFTKRSCGRKTEDRWKTKENEGNPGEAVEDLGTGVRMEEETCEAGGVVVVKMAK
jgi:hypothetical protein